MALRSSLTLCLIWVSPQCYDLGRVHAVINILKGEDWWTEKLAAFPGSPFKGSQDPELASPSGQAGQASFSKESVPPLLGISPPPLPVPAPTRMFHGALSSVEPGLGAINLSFYWVVLSSAGSATWQVGHSSESQRDGLSPQELMRWCHPSCMVSPHRHLLNLPTLVPAAGPHLSGSYSAKLWCRDEGLLSPLWSLLVMGIKTDNKTMLGWGPWMGTHTVACKPTGRSLKLPWGEAGLT